MIELADVKTYLRIPYDDDDGFITRIIQQGYSYLVDAVDEYEALYAGNKEFANKCDMWVLMHWAPSAYDRREGMFTGDYQMDYAARAMLTQLQMYRNGG